MEGQGREMMQGGSVEEHNGVARAREREREARQALAEEAETRVLLMCNENQHQGRDNRKDRRANGWEEERRG